MTKSNKIPAELVLENKVLSSALYAANSKQAKLLILGLSGSILINVFLVWLAFFHFPVTTFVPTSNAAAICNVPAVSEPFVHQRIVEDFATDAAVSIYSFDHANYFRQINDATARYFIDSYRDQFKKTFGDSQLLRAVRENFYVVTATKAGKSPVISRTGKQRGVYTWQVQVPLVVTYISGRKMEEDRQVVTIEVSRTTPSATNPRGIGVSNVVVSRMLN